ncbi:MAG TPA: hydrogenase maturation protease [Gemmatimonadaceae bacterium]
MTSRHTLVIAFGNPLRHDDGAAARVLELLRGTEGVETRDVQQLTPELASDIASARVVVFVDADVLAKTVRIERVQSADRYITPSALTHAPSPEEVVALARGLFGWSGVAIICALPVRDLSAGEGLSRRGEISARLGARAVRRFLRERA